MDNDLMAGNRSSHLLDAELDAECLMLLSKYIGHKAAIVALADEAYLSVVLPVLDPGGASDVAVAQLKAAFAPKIEMRPARVSTPIRRNSMAPLVTGSSSGKRSIYVPVGACWTA